MPKAYGIDFRRKILEAYINKEGSISELSERFKISKSTVKRIAQRYRNTGEVTLYLHRVGRHELIDDKGKETLKKLVSQSPDLTLSEIQEKYEQIHGIKPVLAVFHRVLKKMTYSYKKKSHFAEQQLTEENKKKREEFIAQINQYDVNDMIVLDECGANLAMSRNYGRIENGQRLHCPRPYQRGNKYSVISAISTQKIVASLYCEDSINGEVFSSFIETCLVPHLEKRHKVIMDNVAFHKVKEVEKMITATGAELIYLPPYSPDLSPIELMWSKIKNILRKYSARTADSFQNAISIAFHAVKESDLIGWFKHCGFGIK